MQVDLDIKYRHAIRYAIRSDKCIWVYLMHERCTDVDEEPKGVVTIDA